MNALLASTLAFLAPLAQAAPPVDAAATSGTAEFWVFWIMAPLALGAALSMVLLRNPLHSALMLVLNFFAIAVIYAVLEAQFLAVVQVIVYAGAIMVLFLFVIMLLGVERDDPVGSRLPGQRSAALVSGLLLFGLLTVGVAGPWMGPESTCPAVALPAGTVEARGGRPCVGLAGPNSAEGGNVAGLGRLLFTDYVWPFETTSVLLVIAAIGAMVLGRKSEDPAELTDRGARGAREATPVPAGDAGSNTTTTTTTGTAGSASGATDERGSR